MNLQKLKATSVPASVRAVVGRVCESNKRGEKKDFVARTIGTGVWFGAGGVVLTAKHVVKRFTSPLLFYLYDSGAGVWVRRTMRVQTVHPSWDVALLQQNGAAKEEGEGRSSDSGYEPQVLSTASPLPDADVWSISFPEIIDQTLVPTAGSSDADQTSSTSSATLASSASASCFLSSSFSSFSSASTSASSSGLSASLLFTSESSSVCASSSSSLSTNEKAELSSTPPPSSSPSSSFLTSESTSTPASSLVRWWPQSPVITKGIISKSGFEQLVHVADYISAGNSSGGAVVGQSEPDGWCLIGIHVSVVLEDIDWKRSPKDQITAASATSPFAEFLAIQRIQSWYEQAMLPNAQVFNSATNPKLEPILGKRKAGGSTEQSAGAAANTDEGGGDDEDELVYEVSEGWDPFYDRRCAPVPLPARPRSHTDPPSFLPAPEQRAGEEGKRNNSM